jgi:hypothetical protein
MDIRPPLSSPARIRKCDLSENFCHQPQVILVNHSGPQLAIVQSNIHCAAAVAIRALQMDGEYLFAIQMVRKLQNLRKVKNARAADFQIIIQFFLPLLISIHKSATETGVGTREPGGGGEGGAILFPLCAMGSITALPASVCIGKFRFLLFLTGVCRSLDLIKNFSKGLSQ